MQELNLGFYPKVRFATALEEADSNRQFVADSTLAQAGFEPSARRHWLFTFDHEELVGRGFGPPHLAFATSELPHAGVAVG